MSSPALLLIVDDEHHMRRYLCTLLEGAHYRTLEATSGQEALTLAATHLPAVILLDLGLPDLDGVEVTRRLREWSAAPIIVVSARDREQDKVEALDEGADDYLSKPFSPGELLARVRVALRRVEGAANLTLPEVRFEAGTLCINFAAHEVSRDGEVIALTPIEYRLLTVLARNADRVLTHRQLLKEVWGPGHTEHTHYTRVYMAHLRRKIERDPARPELLITELGIGYRLRTPTR